MGHTNRHSTLPMLFDFDVVSFGYVYCTCFGFVICIPVARGACRLEPAPSIIFVTYAYPFFCTFLFLVDVKNKNFAKKKLSIFGHLHNK